MHAPLSNITVQRKLNPKSYPFMPYPKIHPPTTKENSPAMPRTTLFKTSIHAQPTLINPVSSHPSYVSRAEMVRKRDIN
jgi:hypothetical protein